MKRGREEKRAGRREKERRDSPPHLNFTGERGEDRSTDCVDRGSHIMYTLLAVVKLHDPSKNDL